MENNEVQIRIQDVFASFLKSIVWIAVITIFFAGALGAFGIYKARHTKVSGSYAANIATKEKEVAEKQDEIYNLEKENATIRDVDIPFTENRIAKEQALSESRKEYAENSIYHALDPFNTGVARLTIAVDVEVPEDITEDIPEYLENEQRRATNACIAVYPFTDKALEKVRSILGEDCDLRYIKELIVIVYQNDQYVRLDFFYPDLAKAKKAVDYLYGEMQKAVAEVDPAFTLSIVTEFTGYEVNWSVYDDHSLHSDKVILAEKNMAADMDSLNDKNAKLELNTQKINLATGELNALNNELSAAQNALAAAQQSQSAKKGLVKFGFIGAIAGFFIACAFFYLKYLLGGKIRNRNTIIGRYPYPLLGVVPSTKKYLFGKTIKRLEGDPIYADDDVITAIAANALAIADTEGSTGNCLVGTIEEKDPSLKALKEALDGKVSYAGNILSEARAVKALDKCSHVILVEKRNESQIDSLTEEITKLKSLKKEILGIILL